MRHPCALSLLALAATGAAAGASQTYDDYTSYDLYEEQQQLGMFGRRPKDCPPCFNCNLEDFKCHQFANCSTANGRCECPPGFGGDDCSKPLCGSLADENRSPPKKDRCRCKKGWEGINCNVCTTDEVCNAMMPEGKDGVCYRDGLVVEENYQMCNVTNKMILKQLKDQIPQVTFSCNAALETCNFQFWVDQKESFYCGLDHCSGKEENTPDRNVTTYSCDNIKCRCIPGRMMCGESGSLDLGEFLKESIKGPASFKSTSTSADDRATGDHSEFHEPDMDDLISQVFGDDAIFLSCRSGECLYKTSVPGFKRPIKTINTPLIAGVIAGCALFVVLAILAVWYMVRRANNKGYGPVHLSDDEDDEAAKLLADHKPAALFFENVSYRLNGKHILSGISGGVRPGELLAIMGASGAGKTTFLDMLARKNKRGVAEGDYYLNGEKVLDDEFRSVIGFVDQEDTLLPTLTVHEAIMDSALLRLPKEMSLMAKEQRVEDVEKQLGIHIIRHQTIGSEDGRGISGGEKRRVGIACELVTSPSILFLDEPTSGLDAYNAFNVVESLVNLVKTYNRTVVLTIHQPRSNIVALFDQLILLARGRTVYSGPFADCQYYFDRIGYSCPPGFNIADYLVDLTMHAGTERSTMVDDGSLFSRNGLRTGASSAVAIKSIPSISGASEAPESVASAGESLRPRNTRKSSIKQQQERKLFTRKRRADAETPGTPHTDDGASLPDTDDAEQWMRLSRQQGAPPPQILDDPDQLPPPASGGTGTDLDTLVASYKDSDVAGSVRDDITVAVQAANNANANGPNSEAAMTATAGKVRGYQKVGLWGQFRILSTRTWRNLYRNPMLLLTHYAIAIVVAVFLGFLFYGLTDNIGGFQNRLGLFFFILALFGFSTLTTLTVFSAERLLFVRERAKGYYHPVAYFAAKVVFDIVPLRLLPPIILGAIVYPMTGLIPAWPQFLKFIMFLVLFNLSAAAICLFIGVIFRNAGMANLIGSLIMLFSLLFSGFFINRQTIPEAVRWLQYLSIFHFGFEGLIVNETRYLSLVDKKYGLDIEVPGSAILSSFGFEVKNLWNDCVGLAVFGAVFIVLAYTAMHVLLVERR